LLSGKLLPPPGLRNVPLRSADSSNGNAPCNTYAAGRSNGNDARNTYAAARGNGNDARNTYSDARSNGNDARNTYADASGFENDSRNTGALVSAMIAAPRRVSSAGFHDEPARAWEFLASGLPKVGKWLD